MLRFSRTLRVQVLLLGLGVLIASCELSPTDPPPPAPPQPTVTPSPEGIALYSGNDCKESIVGVTDGASGQLIQFTTDDRFQNDRARSLLFRKLKPGTIIRLFDDPAGNTGDDWVEILVKQEVEGYCVISFESSFEDIVIKVTFSQVNGLDGKVSLMTVDEVADEPAQPSDTPTPPKPSPTATNTPVTPTEVPTEAPSCLVVANALNLRYGPGVIYKPPLQTLSAGTVVLPFAKNGDGSWLEVQLEGESTTGWVSAGGQFISCNFDPSGLPQGQIPPTPTPAPTSTPKLTENPTPSPTFEPSE